MTTTDDNISPEKLAVFAAIRERYKGTDSKSQCLRALEVLKRFAVTTFELMRYLDVYHAPARIMQLRDQGHTIITHWQTVITEAGEKHRVGLYVLETQVQP